MNREEEEEAYAKAADSASVNLGRTYRDVRTKKVSLLKVTGNDAKLKTVGAFVTCEMTMFISGEEMRRACPRIEKNDDESFPPWHRCKCGSRYYIERDTGKKIHEGDCLDQDTEARR